MSKLNEVQQRLSEIDATRFHKMVDVYLSKKYNYQIHSTGTKTGEDKPRKGTPDTLITLDNGNYIFVEYTAQKTKIKDKFLDDIAKCLDSKKTGIAKVKIEKIILACNSSLQSNDIEELQNGCQGIVCDVITNSTLSYDLVNHYPTIAKDFLDIDIGNVLTPNFLKEKYLNNFKTISLLLNNTPKPIDEIFVNLAIIKEKKEEKPNNEYKREALLSSYEEIHKPKELIEIEELINTSKKSLIYGKAGVGKTTLCKYIAYKWANEKLYSEFEYVIYISLREWKTKGLKGSIKDNYYSQDDEDITLNIKENSQKILFLFDGYDELIEEKKRDLQKEIEVYGLTHYIITSRPYGYQRNDFRVDEHFETIGFTDEDVKKYINSFFKDDKQKAKELQAFLENNIGIKHIAYIPLMLEMICSLWIEESFSDSLTMTELYSQVVENILKKHSHDERVYEWENREEIKELLGEIAFKALTNQSILFDGKLIRDTIGRDKLDFFKESIVNSGFLKSDRKDKSVLGNNFEFPHLTFQEYFSALYVASLSPKEQSEIIRDWKFYPHMQMFFAFLGGLIEDKEFLLGEIESIKGDILVHERNYIFSLLLDCLQDMKKEDLNEKRVRKIKTNILTHLDRTLDYPYFLQKLKLVIHFIDNTIISNFIQKANSNNYVLKFKKDLIMFLFFIGKYENEVLDTFIKILKDPNLEDIELFYDKNKAINELITLGNYDEKVIGICFSIIEEDISNELEIIESLLKKYGNYKNKIINLFLQWSQETEHREDNIMQILIEHSFNPSRYSEHKFFLDTLIKNDKFINYYIELLQQDIELERKFSIAIFLFFINTNSSEVLKILTTNPLDTFCFIVENDFCNIFIFIREDEAKNTNIFNTFESLLENKTISLSFENSHKMLKVLIDNISNGGAEKLDRKLLFFITKYYIENENIDLPYRIELCRPSRFYVIQNENKTIKEILKEHYPRYYNIGNKPIKIEKKIEKKLIDILEDKDITSSTINNAIKNKWNRNDFLVSIKNIDIELKNKKVMFDSIVDSQFTDENISLLMELMRDKNIELSLRQYISKLLYEKDIESDEVFNQLIKALKETDLKFVIKLNPERERDIELLDIIVEKINKYYYDEKYIEFMFEKYSLYNFINYEKVINFLFKIIRDKRISSNEKKDLLREASAYFNDNYSQKILDTLIGFINDRGENFGGYDETVVYYLLRPIKEVTTIEDYYIVMNLIKKTIIYRNDDIDNVTWQEIINLLARSPYPYVFLEDNDIETIAKKQFVISCPTESLFDNYKTKYKNMIGFIIYHCRFNKLPLYIKDDEFFYSIKNGEEIFSKERLDKELLNTLPKVKENLKKQLQEKKDNTPPHKIPLIITEGKTDWKHLKKALERFHDRGEYRDLSDDMFDEYENRASGEAFLDQYIKSHATKSQTQKHICIFDRDTLKYVKEYGDKEFIHIMDRDYTNRLKEKIEKYYSDKSAPKYQDIIKKLDNGSYRELDEIFQEILTGKDYKEWQKLSNSNVYAFCIPEIKDSDSPRTLDKICIEFYYKEKDLKTTDSNEKRLFFADEFEFNKEHNGDSSKRFISKCGKFKTESCQVKNGARAELTLISSPVYAIDDEKCQKNLLLSKNDFTNHILNDVKGFDNFDIENFRLIFDVIERIVNA